MLRQQGDQDPVILREFALGDCNSQQLIALLMAAGTDEITIRVVPDPASVRDSKNTTGPTLAIPARAWRTFTRMDRPDHTDQWR